MPAPSVPTSFAVAAVARPWTLSNTAGSSANYLAVKLSWVIPNDVWVRLERTQDGAPWQDVPTGPSGVRAFGVLSAISSGIIGSGCDFRIRAENQYGASAWVLLEFRANGGAPLGPVVLTAPVAALITNSTSQLKISWADDQIHESYFELELEDAVTSTRRIYGGTPFVTEFWRALGTDGVEPLTAYRARVRAVSTRGPLYPPIFGDWSNELFFTTPAPVIVLSLPGTTQMWRNTTAVGSYTITTNTAPTSLTTSALPSGLTLSGAIISGIPTAAVGTHPVTVTATNASGTDIETLSIVVREPAISLRFAKTGIPPMDAATANVNALGKGALTVPLTLLVSAAVTGPVSPTLTSLTISGAPAWLTVSGSTLTGTPTAPGEWDVIVTGANATGQSASAVIHISVPALAITSADTLTVYEQQPIEFPVTSAPAADTISASALPAWLSIIGSTLTGTAPTSGDTALTLTATLGTSTASQEFTLHVLPVLTGPPLGADGMAEITGWVGDPLIEAIYYHGSCSIEHWYLSNQPPGVDVGALTCPGPYAANKSVAIVGAPTTYGIFESVVTAQCCCDGSPKLYRFPVRFNISGGLFLHWFHGDPFRRELQVLLRTGEVHSLYETPAEVLWLKRGDRAKVHILFRDGPFGDSRIARTITTEGFDELRLVIRPLDDFDAEPYFDLGGALVTENVGGKTIAFVEFDVKGDAVSRAFDETNKARGANPAASGLQASGELTWKRSGHPDTSQRFAVRISQDIER